MEKDLNVTLAASDITEIKLDAVRMGVPLKVYALVAFQKFKRLPLNVRRGAFVNSARKTVGRKVRA